jgi:hypothetical protein
MSLFVLGFQLILTTCFKIAKNSLAYVREYRVRVFVGLQSIAAEVIYVALTKSLNRYIEMVSWKRLNTSHSHLGRGLSSGLFPSGFSDYNFYAFLLSPMFRPSHPLDSITVIPFGEVYWLFP